MRNSQSQNFMKLKRFFPHLSFLFLLFFIFENIYGSKPEPCAILIGGFKPTCRIVKAENPPELLKAEEGMELCPGDIVIQESDIHLIKVKLDPFASKKEFKCGGGFRIIYESPKINLFSKIIEMLGFLKEKYVKTVAGSRKIDDLKINFKLLFPQPGYWVTVLPKEPIVFSWPERKKGFFVVFSENNEHEIFRKELKLQNSIKLNPDEINIVASTIYKWGIQTDVTDKITKPYSMLLLSDEDVKKIQTDLDVIHLDMIEKEKSAVKRELINASYFQLISDESEGKIDLYWKSFQILNTISPNELRLEEKQLFIALYENYKQHFLTQLRQYLK